MELTPAFTTPDAEKADAFRLTGDWCGAPVQAVGESLISGARGVPGSRLDLSGVRRMDIAGALAILRALTSKP